VLVVGSAPGLYFVELAFQYAFTSMLVGGAARDAEYVVNHLCARNGAAAVRRASSQSQHPPSELAASDPAPGG